MRELSLHLLDIAENSISAGAKRIKITVIEDSNSDLLQIIVEDNGKGMSAEMVAQVTDPFITTRTTRKVGLGIPLLKAAAEASNGSLKVNSEAGVGTILSVSFQRSHIDRMPMGDLVTTLVNLIVSNPLVHWIFDYNFNGKQSIFDDEPVKLALGDVPMCEPDVLSVIRSMIENTITGINPEFAINEAWISN